MSKYDPEAEEGRGSTGYVSRKDVKIISIVIVLLIAAGVPAFLFLKQYRDKHVCKNNFESIEKGIELYATEFDDHFPLACYMDPSTNTPIMLSDGPRTWMTLIKGMVPSKDAFLCPAASADEFTQTDQVGAATYGMFGPMSSQAKSSIQNPDGTALIGETANDGGNDTYDPLPFLDSMKRRLPDGFLIGFDNTNFTDEDSLQRLFTSAKYLTRLAFPGSSKGQFDQDHAGSRHPGGIHVLTAAGSLRTIPPGAAKLEQLKGVGPSGLWSVR